VSAETAPGYSVRFQQISVAGGQPLEIRALADSQQFADLLGDAEAAGISPATWPLFGQVWPSAQKLADLMQDWKLGDDRVLELGCGLGLASLVVHRRGGNVTASDRHPLTESFLLANLALNHLPAMKYRTGNWTTPNPELGMFDLVIGSDVLYEPDQARQVSDFIECHTPHAAQVLIIDPDRGNRSDFKRRMTTLGFGLTETRLRADLQDGSRYRGRLLHYRRGKA
jgi:predicted nicotinamide N-methyase